MPRLLCPANREENNTDMITFRSPRKRRDSHPSLRLRLLAGIIALLSFAFMSPTVSVGTHGLDAALERAYQEGKHVLVPFGANW